MEARTLVRPRRALIALAVPLTAAVLLAVLAVGLTPQTVHPQSAPASTAAAPAATPDCSNPPAGQRARLVAEDEIAAAFRGNTDTKLQATEANNNGFNLDLINGWTSTGDALSSVTMPAIALADLQGDGSREAVMAFRDKNKALSVVTNRGGVAWYRNIDHDMGALAWIDIASGNINAATQGDEVVVALSNDTNDIDVILLSGDSAGNIAQTANNQLARYTVTTGPAATANYVSVATGDLDRDGVDEIITSFKDGNGDLHAIILKYSSGSTFTVLLDKSWTNYERGHVADGCTMYENHDPMDVAMGDVDGDWADEAILAFRSGKCEITGDIQMLVLNRNADGTYDDRVFMTKATGTYQSAANAVAVDAADVDGDGVDEIALFYTRVYSSDIWAWQQILSVWEYVPPYAPAWSDCSKDAGTMMQCFCMDEANHPRACIQERRGTSSTNVATTEHPLGQTSNRREADVALATGDIDADGKEEIATAYYWKPDASRVIKTWDAESGLGLRTERKILPTAGEWAEEFSLAAGDVNNDTRWGIYEGTCDQQKEAQITALLHSPPYWPHINDDDPEAAYAEHVGSGGGTSQGGKSTWGGSLKIGGELELEGLPAFGASVTREFETGLAVEGQTITTTIEGTSFGTFPIWVWEEDGYYDALQIVDTKFWCYDYREEVDRGVGPMALCLPRPANEQTLYSFPLSYWYTAGPTTYPNSWVPVGINLAQGRTAAQSSDFEATSGAGLAVDGNRDGDYFGTQHSVSRTNRQANAWWEVDLDGSQFIDAVLVWNRTDGPPEVAACLSDYYVYVSDEPFLATDTPATLQPRIDAGDVWASHQAGQAGRPSVIAVNKHGRYVRVQLAGTNFLNLAEVEVYGRPLSVDQWPISQPVTGTNSFKLTWPSTLEQTVPGKLMYTRQGPRLGVTYESGTSEFDLGIEGEGEQVTEYSTGQSWSLGVETAIMEAETKSGTESTSGYILSWQKSLEFSGAVSGWQQCVLGARPYSYMPYLWLQQARGKGGTDQAYLVLDYWVPEVSAPITDCVQLPPEATNLVPLAPVITSPTHPVPGTWYASSTATFNWAQPEGDPAEVDGYAWRIDHDPTTEVPPRTAEIATTATFPGLASGDWYFHLRARAGSKWSTTVHRLVRVDTAPPIVTLAVSPPAPDGNAGWHVSPVTLAASATDDGGSGLATLEVSTDGTTWQPYITSFIFTADTKGTTVWARAKDVVGNVSQPVQATIKIDRTKPNSHVSGGSGPGTWASGVYTNSVGNGVLALAGAIADAGSGRTGMHIRADAGNWTSAGEVGSWHPFPDKPALEVNWAYTATHELGAGYHIFYGQSQDEAGNLEAPYEIGRVTWFPESSPDLGGSSMAASPSVVRPGDTVRFTLTVRNGGFQEALAGLSDVLPAGLTPVADKLPPDVAYDPVANTLTWPSRLLWPGDFISYSFEARAAAGLPAGTLESTATAHAYWPNTDLLAAADRQRFTSREQKVAFRASVRIDPALAAGADVTPPWASLKAARSPEEAGQAEVTLRIAAASDASRIYLREWKLDPATGQWMVARSSGWMPYAQAYPWTLSAGQGVKYLGAWVADAAGNVSVLDEASLTAVNRLDGSQALAAGQRIQYRGNEDEGMLLIAYLKTVSGDPDMYAWAPGNAFRPDRGSNEDVGPGGTEDMGGRGLEQGGRYLLEVQAAVPSEYKLSVEGYEAQSAAAAALAAESVKPWPQHPLTVSDPLSAGELGPAVTLKTQGYLPLIFK